MASDPQARAQRYPSLKAPFRRALVALTRHARPQPTAELGELVVPDLPSDVMPRLFSSLAGDVATLCAAACVSRQWRKLAASPALWTALLVHGAAARAALTPQRLASLLDRGGGMPLRALDLTACVRLTGADVLAALQGRAMALDRLCLSGLHALPSGGGRWSRLGQAFSNRLLALTAAPRLAAEAGSEDEEQEPLYSSDEEQQDAEQQQFHRRPQTPSAARVAACAVRRTRCQTPAAANARRTRLCAPCAPRARRPARRRSWR